ncbi:MAG: hypothetical protein AAGD35_21410 [Actinomycetota bacterium]
MIRRLTRLHIALLAAVVLSATAAVVTSVPAEAQTGSCSGLDRIGTRCVISSALDPVRPTPGTDTIRTSSPPGPRFVWLNLLVPCEAAGSGGWTSLTDLASAIFDVNALAGAGPFTEPGVLWVGELIDPATGGTNTGYVSCVGAGGPPPLPPPLPTADEIWGAALTYDPEVNLDPYVRGLTGLETFMWYEGPTADTVDLVLNGYTVTATIATVEFGWDMGGEDRDGRTAHISPNAGSPDAPAATHTYAVPEEVTVVHEITWTGSSVITGAGLPAGGVVVDLGTAVVATARDYEVIEVRTPLVGD